MASENWTAPHNALQTTGEVLDAVRADLGDAAAAALAAAMAQRDEDEKPAEPETKAAVAAGLAGRGPDDTLQ
jgi:hypothetical protein